MWGPTQAREPPGEAEGRLQLGAAGEDRPPSPAARSAMLSGTYPRERLIRSGAGRSSGSSERTTESSARIVDRAVVEQERVGDRAEPLQRFVVAVGDRLVGDVARGQHQRLAGVGEEQVVQGRVREHHSEVGAAGRDRRGDRGAGPSPGDRRSAARVR